MSLWGKDCATGAGAETSVDALEEINLCNEETDTFEYEIDEQAEGPVDEEFVRDETRKSEMEIVDSSVYSSSKKPTTRKKKRKSDDILGDLVGVIRKYISVVIEANEEIKTISTYFKKQTESNDRKMRIYDELMELSDFSQQEIMDVGEYILKDAYKVDNYFALPKVRTVLLSCAFLYDILYIGTMHNAFSTGEATSIKYMHAAFSTGETTSIKYIGTMHGAFFTGLMAAKECRMHVLEKYGNPGTLEMFHPAMGKEAASILVPLLISHM